tara:strand:- start:3912 stop:5240 length:1329 start_codon:yes stop_codon:yes gene_type:complete
MSKKEIKQVIDSGLCYGCGACIALDESEDSKMIDTEYGPIPFFAKNSKIPKDISTICPSVGINYPMLYKYFFRKYPNNWLTGEIEAVRTGYSNDQIIRDSSASGGVITETLIYLLENKLVDGVILAKQGLPTAEKARAFIASTRKDIIECSQSVYIPVSMLDILKKLDPSKKYAITCLSDQSASLRALQKKKYPPALQIKFILGPYTGTSLYPAAIRSYLRSKKIKDNDQIKSLKWRSGAWPGYLEIKTESGRVLKSPKVYYNYLIPFFITQTSLQSMDFVNEFADLAVGDAWSPKYEGQTSGYSIVVTRTKKMEAIIQDMIKKNILNLQLENPFKASDMHGHMLDFKKRGGYIRNTLRKISGKYAPEYGYRPAKIGLSRILIEVIINIIFFIGKTKFARYLIEQIPESIIGPIFNNSRLFWKKLSRPTKRKGLANYKVFIN